MNYLAHLLLSGDNLDRQVGGLLGDFVKGPLKGTYPPHIEQGIALHRHIDTLTAQLPDITELYCLFEQPWRRYAGIVIDIAFDHLLAQRWHHFHKQPLEEFCANFYKHLASHHQYLPERARQFSERAPQIRWLESYADADIITTILDRVGTRFRKPVVLGDCWHIIEAERPSFDIAFDKTMTKLNAVSATFLNENLKGNLSKKPIQANVSTPHFRGARPTEVVHVKN